MNRNMPLTELPNQPDDVDRLLSRFFQTQLPAPWPPAPRPDAIADRAMPAARLPAYASIRSLLTGPRMALAASVALLLGSIWFLSNQTANVPAPLRTGANIENGTAEKVHPHEIGKTPRKAGVDKPMP
jgi:hypothetical protein